MNENDVIIDVKDLHKSYGQTEVIKGVDMTVRKGEVICIIGPSGAGKSTILRCLNGLEQATGGKIVVNGHDLTDSHVNIDQVREQVGMVFQHFNLFNNMSVIDNITLAPKLVHHETDEQARAHAMELLKTVGLAEKADAMPKSLSGGQKQRVGIARALATEPSILLSDESTSALDPKTTKAILKLLKKINRELKITIVLITHEMNVIQTICNHVAVMENGRIVERGEVLEVFSEPKQEITRNFVKTVINDSVPELLVESIKSEKKNNKLLKLKFLDSDSTESVLSGVNKNYDVETNILFANISEIQERVLGIIIVQIVGSVEAIDGAQQYFTKHGVGYTEIGL